MDLDSIIAATVGEGASTGVAPVRVASGESSQAKAKSGL